MDNLNFIRCSNCFSNINTKYIKSTEFASLDRVHYDDGSEIEVGYVHCPLCNNLIEFNASTYPELTDLFSTYDKNKSKVVENPFGAEDPFGAENPFGAEDPFGAKNPFGGIKYNPFGAETPFGVKNPF